ncbi:MAG: hypothetical protein H7A25_05925 [Leptospiraceae bacterium]|nr:hypothetical protein [Leptospiraceae bacterium]MCP5499420.1 hypothetical protein [Leptospiraceae bacterium]
MKEFFFKEGIHPSAIVEDGAKIGSGVSIGAYSVIGPNVVLKDGVKIAQNVMVSGFTTIEEEAEIYPFNIIGGPAQDLKYLEYEGKLKIGKKDYCSGTYQHTCRNSSFRTSDGNRR